MSLVSNQLVDFVKKFEGFSATPYLDPVGVKTLGYGMTGPEIKGLDSVTEEQASKMLEDLLNNKYAAPLKADLDSKSVQLNQNQFDALVSMAYNVGVNGVLGSTLYRNICNGVRDKDTITSNFQMWCMAGGKRLEGLYRRRTEEAEMFLKDDVPEQKKTWEYYITTTISGELQAAINSVYKTNLATDCKLGDITFNAIKDNHVLVKSGQKNTLVRVIQKRLMQLGYSLPRYGADGAMSSGGETEKAVKNFQSDRGLDADGLVGINTIKELFER